VRCGVGLLGELLPPEAGDLVNVLEEGVEADAVGEDAMEVVDGVVLGGVLRAEDMSGFGDGAGGAPPVVIMKSEVEVMVDVSVDEALELGDEAGVDVHISFSL